LVTAHPLTGGKMGFVPNFREIANGNVIASEMPFSYLDIGGNYEWLDNKRLQLNNSFFAWNPSGHLELIMNRDWSARIRISTESYGAFGDTIKDALGIDNVQAYNFDFSNPFVPTSRWKSSMTFSLRGSGMLGIWVDGHPTSEVWGEGAFDDEVRVRLGGSPTPTAFNNGFFISLTHPNKDYNNRQTFTLKINDVDNETMVEILEIEELEQVPTTPRGGQYSPEQISVEDLTGRYIYAQGTSSITGRDWVIEIAQYEGSWFVFKNGVDENFYSNEADAIQRAESLKQQAIKEADRTEEETDPVDTINFGGVAITGVLILAVFAIYVTARR